MSEPMFINAEEAEEIALFDHVARQDVEEHRWYTKQLVVFELDGRLMGFYYLDPATEMQEDQDRFEAEPVPIFPVAGREVTTTVYGPADE